MARFEPRSRYLTAVQRLGRDVPLLETKANGKNGDWYDLASGKGILLLADLRDPDGRRKVRGDDGRLRPSQCRQGSDDDPVPRPMPRRPAASRWRPLRPVLHREGPVRLAGHRLLVDLLVRKGAGEGPDRLRYVEGSRAPSARRPTTWPARFSARWSNYDVPSQGGYRRDRGRPQGAPPAGDRPARLERGRGPGGQGTAGDVRPGVVRPARRRPMPTPAVPWWRREPTRSTPATRSSSTQVSRGSDLAVRAAIAGEGRSRVTEVLLMPAGSPAEAGHRHRRCRRRPVTAETNKADSR